MRKDIKAINEAFLSVISENTEPRSFDDVMDDVMGLVDRGHINDESQAIDMLTAELGRDLTPEEEQEITGYFNGSEGTGDIEPTPADPNASWNPRDWEDEESMGAEDEEMGSEDAEESVAKKHDDIFYRVWENVVDRLSDEELEATAYMIRNYDALNKLIKEETRYRVSQFAKNAANQYKLDRE
jgi:hypothetical protein